MLTLKALLLVSAIPVVSASTVDVCLVNENALAPETMRSIEDGLRTQERELGISLRFTCTFEDREANTGGRVLMRLRGAPASHQDPDALGAAMVQDGRVLPDLEVFCNSVRRTVETLRPVSPELEGWAVSKVAAHELYHYVWNEHEHRRNRVNEKFMTAAELIHGFRSRKPVVNAKR